MSRSSHAGDGVADERAATAGASVHDRLAAVVLHAPGKAAPRSALSVLRALAQRGDIAAALAIARVVATELGLEARALVADRCSSFASLVELEDVPPLACLLAAGFLPRQLIADLDRWKTRANDAFPDDSWSLFRALIARRGVAQDDAMRGYILATVVQTAAMGQSTGVAWGNRFTTHMIDVTMRARVVPGDNADASFEFGRDLLLTLPGPGAFRFRVGHEIGHHVTDAVMGRWLSDRDHDTAVSCGALATLLPGLLDAAVEPPPGAPQYQSAQAPSGLRATCSYDHLDRGSFVHLSVSDDGGPVEAAEGVALAYLVTEILEANPRAVALAHSPRGVFHIGLPSTGVDLKRVRKRAARPKKLIRSAIDLSGPWLTQVVESGRLSIYEGDLPRLLGLWPHPAVVAADAQTAADDLGQLELMLQDDLAAQSANVLRGLLHVATRCGNPTAVARVLTAGVAPAHAGDADTGIERLGESLAAIWDGSTADYLGPSPDALVSVVRLLVEAGFDVNGAVLEDGETLLTDAAAREPALTAALLEAGVSTEGRSARDATALSAARSPAEAEALLAAGAEATAADDEGETALHRAAGRDSGELVRLLLARGASPAARSLHGETPLHFASSPDVIASLCDAGAEVNAATNTGATALMGAAHRGDEPTVRALLALGGEVHQATAKGETALHFAAQAPLGRTRGTLDALLAAGADVDEEANDGQTALVLAAVVANDEAVDVLVEAGADVNAAMTDGTTPLMCASLLDRELSRDPTHIDRMQACMKRLIEAGAAVEAANDEGDTALHYATLGFDVGPTDLLLESGANPNVRNEKGEAPLDHARAQRHAKMIEDLLARGATGGTGTSDG